MAALAEELSDAYSRLFDDMVRYARRRIPDPSEAEDIVNDCFLKIWQGNRDIWHFPAYLHTAVRREIAGRLRARRDPTVPLDSVASDAGDIDVELAVVERERGRELRNALACLPERQATVLSLWGEGMAPAEIARELSSGEIRWSSNQVSCLLNRAKRTVRRQLTERGVASIAVPAWWRIKLWAASWSERTSPLLDPALVVPPVLALMVVLGGLSPQLEYGPGVRNEVRPASYEIVEVIAASGIAEAHPPRLTNGTRTSVSADQTAASRVAGLGLSKAQDRQRQPGLVEQVAATVSDPIKGLPTLGCWSIHPICTNEPPQG